MGGPFLIQCPDFLEEKIGTIQKFRAQPPGKFGDDGKVVQLNESEPSIQFKCPRQQWLRCIK